MRVSVCCECCVFGVHRYWSAEHDSLIPLPSPLTAPPLPSLSALPSGIASSNTHSLSLACAIIRSLDIRCVMYIYISPVCCVWCKSVPVPSPDSIWGALRVCVCMFFSVDLSPFSHLTSVSLSLSPSSQTPPRDGPGLSFSFPFVVDLTPSVGSEPQRR